MIAASRVVGEFLVSRKVLSRDVLEEALLREAESGIPLTKLLASEGMVGERDLIAAIGAHLGIPVWDPDRDPIPSIVAGMLPLAMAQRLRAVAVGMSSSQLRVAMEDPTNQPAVDQISKETGWNVEPVLSAAADISLAIEVLYNVDDAPAAARADLAVTDEPPPPAELHLNTLLTEMVAAGASDLHISAGLPPCIRVDGHLR
ncbi:MAG TPA: hypothetical protein VMO88_07185, partial [Acidimicrobiales bacterium]|nr:hypothetical protein [Acidimicrobiales bacterium]